MSLNWAKCMHCCAKSYQVDTLGFRLVQFVIFFLGKLLGVIVKTLSLLIAVISASMLLLSGCGLKKDLYLPEANTQVVEADANK